MEATETFQNAFFCENETSQDAFAKARPEHKNTICFLRVRKVKESLGVFEVFLGIFEKTPQQKKGKEEQGNDDHGQLSKGDDAALVMVDLATSARRGTHVCDAESTLVDYHAPQKHHLP